MIKITLEYLETHFDEVLQQTESGASFLIMTPDGQDVALVPHKDTIKMAVDEGLVTPMDDDYFNTMRTNDT